MPIVRERAIKLAPATIGVALETKMSEDELKQVLAWLESPADARNSSRSLPKPRNGFARRWSPRRGRASSPSCEALDGRIRVILGVAACGAARAPAPAPGRVRAAPPSRPSK